jgi:cation transport ATPase
MKNIQLTKYQLRVALLIAPIPYLIFLTYFYKELFYEESLLEVLISISSIFSLFITIYICICFPIFYLLCLKLIKHNRFNTITIILISTTITALSYLYQWLITDTNPRSDLVYFPSLYIFSFLNTLSFLGALHFFNSSSLKLNDKIK